MSDDSGRTTSVGLANARTSLASDGYALTNDEMVGLPNNFRQSFLNKYFNDDVLHHDEGDWPIDRKRARDVIRYQWRDDGVHLWEHGTITITDRAGIPGKRDHSRIQVLDDPDGHAFVEALLNLVPRSRRQGEGTFGINLFRTFTDVVTKPHHDHEQFVILYVLDRVGDGAESYLYRPEDVMEDGQPTAGPVVKHQLDQGEILIFEDNLFEHGATPLVSPPGGQARRDVLVCTIDYPETYLEGQPPLAEEDALSGSGAR